MQARHWQIFWLSSAIWMSKRISVCSEVIRLCRFVCRTSYPPSISRSSDHEIRPIKVLILNLMPKKIETENQFLRLLSNSPLQVDIQLLRIDSRESRNTPAEHLNNFYCNFEDIQEQNFDGLIVT